MRTQEDYRASIKEALQAADPFQALHTLARREVESGTPHTTLLDWHEQARSSFPDQEDLLLDVMDCLVGWCAGSLKIPPSRDPAHAGGNGHIGADDSERVTTG